MISLFLTALLGLFCCSSINFNALDHTKEIEVKENSIKRSGEYDNLNEGYFFQSDLLSNAFATTFFPSLARMSTAFAKFSPYTTETDYINWSISYDNPGTGLNANLHRASTGGIWSAYYVISKYHIEKTSATYYNADNVRSDYQISIYLEDSPSLPFVTYYYTLMGNLINNSNQDLGLSVVSCSVTINDSDVASWYSYVIVESRYNGSQSITPFIRNFLQELPQHSNTYEDGYRNGYADGIQVNDLTQYREGYNTGLNDGIQIGYADGLQQAVDNATALTIFSGFIDVGLLPINVFLQILNFEVFGINIGGLVSSFLTITIVIIIIRFLLGSKND